MLTSPEFEDTKLNIQVKRHFKKEEKGLLKKIYKMNILFLYKVSDYAPTAGSHFLALIRHLRSLTVFRHCSDL